MKIHPPYQQMAICPEPAEFKCVQLCQTLIGSTRNLGGTIQQNRRDIKKLRRKVKKYRKEVKKLKSKSSSKSSKNNFRSSFKPQKKNATKKVEPEPEALRTRLWDDEEEGDGYDDDEYDER